MKKIYTLISGLVMVVLAISGCASPAPSAPSAPAGPATGIQVGNLAPDFDFVLFSQQGTLRGLQGKPVLLNFWATWCGPCRVEIPFLQDIYSEHSSGELKRSGEELVMLFVNVGEGVETVMSFIRSYNVIIPVVFDSNNEIARKYRVNAIPATYFIDKSGIIRAVKIGSFSSKAEIEKSLKLISP